MTEREFAEHIAGLASQNKIYTSYIGMGWYDTVLLRRSSNAMYSRILCGTPPTLLIKPKFHKDVWKR